MSASTSFSLAVEFPFVSGALESATLTASVSSRFSSVDDVTVCCVVTSASAVCWSSSGGCVFHLARRFSRVTSRSLQFRASSASALLLLCCVDDVAVDVDDVVDSVSLNAPLLLLLFSVMSLELPVSC